MSVKNSVLLRTPRSCRHTCALPHFFFKFRHLPTLHTHRRHYGWQVQCNWWCGQAACMSTVDGGRGCVGGHQVKPLHLSFRSKITFRHYSTVQCCTVPFLLLNSSKNLYCALRISEFRSEITVPWCMCIGVVRCWGGATYRGVIWSVCIDVYTCSMFVISGLVGSMMYMMYTGNICIACRGVWDRGREPRWTVPARQ